MVYQLVLGLFEVRLKRIHLTSGTRTQNSEAGGDLRVGVDLLTDGLRDEIEEGGGELRIHFLW